MSNRSTLHTYPVDLDKWQNTDEQKIVITAKITGFKGVYFCCKVGYFNTGVSGARLTFETNVKWPLDELQFLALPHCLHFITHQLWLNKKTKKNRNFVKYNHCTTFCF